MECSYGIIEYGVYAQGVSGKLYTFDEWNSQETLNGVAFITENHSFLVAPDIIENKAMCSEENEGIDVGLEPWYSYEEGYAGYKNTRIIRDNYGDISSDYAPGAALNYRFQNGVQGYIPSMDELKLAWDNKGDNTAGIITNVFNHDLWTSSVRERASAYGYTTFFYWKNSLDDTSNVKCTHIANVLPFGKLDYYFK